MMIAHCINYLISRFNMLADTQELISYILKKNENQTVYEKIIQSPRVNTLKTMKMKRKIKTLKSSVAPKKKKR